MCILLSVISKSIIKQQIIITDKIIIIEQIISEEYCHYRHVRFSSCNRDFHTTDGPHSLIRKSQAK